MSDAALDAIVVGVRLLCLDAGNTVIFLDHARIARLLGQEGHEVSAATLIRCEGEAKCLLEDGYGERPTWEYEREVGAIGWGRTIATMLAQANVDRARIPELLAKLWQSHLELNLWWLVPEGMGAALDEIRALGVKVVIVSNSEGMLDVLFERLKIASHFDLVVDSGKVGVEKPEPGIWQIALAVYPTAHDEVLHLGDTYATDIAGAQGLGLRTALIDPYGHYTKRHLAVPRVPGVVEVAQAIVRSASRLRTEP
jgi:FMN phosphatase YigB (HAD superfamily)